MSWLSVVFGIILIVLIIVIIYMIVKDRSSLQSISPIIWTGIFLIIILLFIDSWISSFYSLKIHHINKQMYLQYLQLQ